MSSQVIQGFFLGGQPRVAPGVVAPPMPNYAAQAKARPHRSAPPPTAFAPPAGAAQRKAAPAGPSAFAPKQPAVAQRFGGNDAFAVDPARLGLNSGGGRALPEGVRGKMEAAFGADFSSVRVHVGPQAERVGAIAFTLGQDIYFAPGRFQPDTVLGQQLLGHELAHVVQQRQGRVRNPLGSGVAVVQDRALEAEADRLGVRAAQAKLQRSSGRIRVSTPAPAGPGRYRVTAGSDGNEVGSVTVNVRETGATEVTDLSVTPAYRGSGIGQMLLASAARTGLQSGRARLALAAQDNGSGRLARWYREIGFSQVGMDRRGYPKMEASAGRVLARILPVQSLLTKSAANLSIRSSHAILRMEAPTPSKPLPQGLTGDYGKFYLNIFSYKGNQDDPYIYKKLQIGQALGLPAPNTHTHASAAAPNSSDAVRLAQIKVEFEEWYKSNKSTIDAYVDPEPPKKQALKKHTPEQEKAFQKTKEEKVKAKEIEKKIKWCKSQGKHTSPGYCSSCKQHT